MKNDQTLSGLRSHLFDALERVKSINDPNASENEKMSVDQAKVFADISGKIIESAKVEAQVLQIMSKADNPNLLEQSVHSSGLFLASENSKLNQ